MRGFTGVFIDAFVDEIQRDSVMADHATENVPPLPILHGDLQFTVKAVKIAVLFRPENEIILRRNRLVLLGPRQEDGRREEGGGHAGEGRRLLEG